MVSRQSRGEGIREGTKNPDRVVIDVSFPSFLDLPFFSSTLFLTSFVRLLVCRGGVFLLTSLVLALGLSTENRRTRVTQVGMEGRSHFR